MATGIKTPVSFYSLLAKLKTARSLSSGKPDRHNTRFYLGEGTLEDPKRIDIRFYSTNILRFYPDGSIDVSTNFCSQSTLARLEQYANVRPSYTRLPTINKRLPSPSKVYTLRGAIFRGVGGYLRVTPEGKVDLDSVSPTKIEYISDPSQVSRFTRTRNNLIPQIILRIKLGQSFPKVRDPQAWFLAQAGKPLEAVDYTDCPGYSPTYLTTNPIDIARHLKVLQSAHIKRIPDCLKLGANASSV